MSPLPLRGKAAGPVTVWTVLTGIGIVLSGIFVEPEPGVPSFHGLVHELAFIVVFGASIATYFPIAGTLRADEAWRDVGRYSAFTGVAVLVILLQRAPMVVAFAWHAVVGGSLLRRRRERPSRADANVLSPGQRTRTTHPRSG
jgi:hypothetical protein